MAINRQTKILFLAWLIPGLGHYCLGYKWKGVVLFGLLLLMYSLGVDLAALHNVSFREPLYLVVYSFTGGFTSVALLLSAYFPITPQYYPFGYQLGCLYTSIASFLNGLIIVHAYQTMQEPACDTKD